MTQNDIRRKDLRKKESLFLQQSPYLQRMGRARARETENDAIADQLRDLDLLVWDETDKYLSHFSADLNYAPHVVDDLLAETARLGRTIGMEVELPSLVAALTIVRILAGGDEVFEKHKPIWIAIMRSQDLDPQAKPFFEKYCQEIEANKLDPATGEETLYRRGDPIERAKDTEEAKTETHIEGLFGQILEATKGWNRKDAFGDYWNLWTKLWVYLLKQEEMVEKVSQLHPNSNANKTSINITLVCNVAGLLNKHLKSLSHDVPSCTKLADFIKEEWDSSQCHKELDKITKLSDEQANQIKGWLVRNVK